MHDLGHESSLAHLFAEANLQVWANAMRQDVRGGDAVCTGCGGWHAGYTWLVMNCITSQVCLCAQPRPQACVPAAGVPPDEGGAHGAHECSQGEAGVGLS